jgi:hypothetical protein
LPFHAYYITYTNWSHPFYLLFMQIHNIKPKPPGESVLFITLFSFAVYSTFNCHGAFFSSCFFRLRPLYCQFHWPSTLISTVMAHSFLFVFTLYILVSLAFYYIQLSWHIFSVVFTIYIIVFYFHWPSTLLSTAMVYFSSVVFTLYIT